MERAEESSRVSTNSKEERYRNIPRSLHPRDSGRGKGVGGQRCLSSRRSVFCSGASILRGALICRQVQISVPPILKHNLFLLEMKKQIAAQKLIVH